MMHPYLYAGLRKTDHEEYLSHLRATNTLQRSRAKERTMIYGQHKIEAMAERAGWTVDYLLNGGRKRKLNTVRQVIMYVLREDGYTYKEIGRMMGGRDHATIMHGEQAARDAIAVQDAIFAHWWPRVTREPFPPRP